MGSSNEAVALILILSVVAALIVWMWGTLKEYHAIRDTIHNAQAGVMEGLFGIKYEEGRWLATVGQNTFNVEKNTDEQFWASFLAMNGKMIKITWVGMGGFNVIKSFVETFPTPVKTAPTPSSRSRKKAIKAT